MLSILIQKKDWQTKKSLSALNSWKSSFTLYIMLNNLQELEHKRNSIDKKVYNRSYTEQEMTEDERWEKSINLRRKEFAILRSVGLSPKGFNKMIWFESLFFGIKSLLYGLPVGIFLSFVISNNMNKLVLSPFDLPIGSIAICIIGTFVIVLITMWYSTAKIKKENILEEIRRENI